jgi:hypothetical protein
VVLLHGNLSYISGALVVMAIMVRAFFYETLTLIV